MKLETLYNSIDCNPLCVGCSILTKEKPFHCYLDYETLHQSPILFLSESLRVLPEGEIGPFSKEEKRLINSITLKYTDKYTFSAAVKCPNVKEKDITPDDKRLCRKHLEATIDKVKPELVFVCGNLAMAMLIKKSGIIDKRGNAYNFESENGHSCIVVPIYHPFSVIIEPRYRNLFQIDIHNAIQKYVDKSLIKQETGYTFVLDENDIVICKISLGEASIMAIDIETTGLDFITDTIHTVAIASDMGNFVIPVDHRDSSLDRETTIELLKLVLSNNNIRKVMHNAKFDLKFMRRYGIDNISNVWDTQLMAKLTDENRPAGLLDLVKQYFPEELEEL